MTKEDIQSTVSRIIKERFLVNCDNKYDDSLIDAGLDSMKMIQLIVELEKIFGFEFEDEMLSYEMLHNVEEISEYIYERLLKSSVL